jgi:hypothetical protein
MSTKKNNVPFHHCAALNEQEAADLMEAPAVLIIGACQACGRGEKQLLSMAAGT